MFPFLGFDDNYVKQYVALYKCDKQFLMPKDIRLSLSRLHEWHRTTWAMTDQSLYSTDAKNVYTLFHKLLCMTRGLI